MIWPWVPAWLQALAHARAFSLSLAACSTGWTYAPDDALLPTRAAVVCQSTAGGTSGLGSVVWCTWKGCS